MPTTIPACMSSPALYDQPCLQEQALIDLYAFEGAVGCICHGPTRCCGGCFLESITARSFFVIPEGIRLFESGLLLVLHEGVVRGRACVFLTIWRILFYSPSFFTCPTTTATTRNFCRGLLFLDFFVRLLHDLLVHFALCCFLLVLLLLVVASCFVGLFFSPSFSCEKMKIKICLSTRIAHAYIPHCSCTCCCCCCLCNCGYYYY